MSDVARQRGRRAAAAYGEGTVCLMSSQFMAGVGGRAMLSYSFTALQVCGATYLSTDRKGTKFMRSNFGHMF